jgi:CotS family spore coat protein
MEEANQVLAGYDLAVRDVSLLQDEGEKAVWIVETGDGRFGLKRLPHPFGKSLFVTAAQDYLFTRGVRVPRIVATRSGELVVERDGRAYSVTEWLPGARRPSLAATDDLAAIVKALARMHAGSRGYSPPPAATISSKLGRWHAHYQKMLEDLNEWKAVAEA